MGKLKIVSLLSYLFGLAIQAQTKISGHVYGQNNHSLSFASVVLFKDSNLVAGTSSNEAGAFTLVTDLAVHKTYQIKISLIGYETYSKTFIYPDTSFMKALVLLANKNDLRNVIVTGSKPLVTRKSDRYIINVENSFLANGNTGLEVLQKSPGIWVDNTGSIHIKGTAPVMVMINDVVQRMTEEDLQEYLRTLKSEDISKIEVIANPPSEYEAQGAGGIIHIILKKARKDGFNGSVNAQYRQQQNKPFWLGGASLDYKIKSIYLFGNYSINSDIKPLTEASELIFNNTRFFNNATTRTDNYLRKQYRIGLAYDVAPNQIISIQTNNSTNTFLQSMFSTIINKTAINFIYGNSSGSRQRYTNFNTSTFNYLYKLDSIGSTLKILADYSTNNKTETSQFIELYSDTSDNSIYRNNAPNSIKIFSAQTDYTKSFKNKTDLKIGFKYVAIERNNEIIKDDLINNNWLNNKAASDHFIYNENLLMAYTSLEKQLHQTNIKIGLRAEETISKGNSITTNQQFTKRYIGLFPSIYITQTLNETKGNSLFINYSRRLTRPTLSDLNPNRLQFTTNTAMVGNPNLLPQYSHNIELGGTYLNTLNANIYFTKTTNIITLIANADSNNFINYTSANLNNSTEYGINLNAPFKIIKHWSVINSVELNNLSYTFNNSIVHQTTFSARAVNTINLKKIMDIDIVASYRSATQYSNIASPGIFYADIGFTKKIMRQKGILRLYLADIFNTIYEKETTNETNLYIYFYRKRPTQIASISFTYNFSVGKKFTTTKIEQSGNDTRNRIGN